MAQCSVLFTIVDRLITTEYDNILVYILSVNVQSAT